MIVWDSGAWLPVAAQHFFSVHIAVIVSKHLDKLYSDALAIF